MIEIFGQFLNIKEYFALSYIVKLISTGSHIFSDVCCSIDCRSGISLNYKTYFRHAQLLKHYLYLKPFNTFSSEPGKFNSNYY